MPDAEDIRWFKMNFQGKIKNALTGMPITLDMLTALACQETGEIWPVLRKKGLTMTRLLELCVGDTLDDTSTSPRKAFPRNKQQLVNHPNGFGQAMFDLARHSLVEMADYIPGYKSMVQKPNKMCHGFGIFQYDLQFFPEDPQYFLQKKYADFDACLAKCIGELKKVLNKFGWSGRTELSDIEKSYLAIAYNIGPGNFKESKGLKQGYKSGGKYYGELFYNYLQLSKTIVVEDEQPANNPVVISPAKNGQTTLAPEVLAIKSLTHLPAKPKAGDQFTVGVELNREVKTSDGDVRIVFQVQRLVPDLGGHPQIRPASYTSYFDQNFLPPPMLIPVGGKFGFSNSFKVLKDASAPDGEFPVHFPEQLVISAYLNGFEGVFVSEIIQIQAHDNGLRNLSGDLPLVGLLSLPVPEGVLKIGEKVPNKPEREAVGLGTQKILRGTARFNALIQNNNPEVVFKNEEGTGADRLMTVKLSRCVDALAVLVKKEWPDIKLRITEAWDENNEHAPNSVHYEARAVDMTTSDRDRAKFGRLARLAVAAGFEWVFYENSAHVHASVSR